MSEHRSAAEPGDAHRDPAHYRGVVSPTDPDPVNGQRSGLPFDGNAWLVIDAVNTSVPCRGHSGPYACLPRRSNLAAQSRPSTSIPIELPQLPRLRV